MENIKQLWLVVVDVWEKGLFGIDIGRIVVALAIFFISLLLRQLLASLAINRLAAIAKRTRFKFDDEIVEVLRKPLAFIPVILGFFLATQYLSLTGTLEIAADRLLRSLIVYVIFWSLVRLVQPLSFLLQQLKRIVFRNHGGLASQGYSSSVHVHRRGNGP